MPKCNTVIIYTIVVLALNVSIKEFTASNRGKRSLYHLICVRGPGRPDEGSWEARRGVLGSQMRGPGRPDEGSWEAR